MTHVPTFIPISNCRANGGTAREVACTVEELLAYVDAARSSNPADIVATSTGTNTLTLAAASGEGTVVVPLILGRVSLGSTAAANGVTWTAAGAKGGSASTAEIALAPNWSFMIERPGEEALFLLVPPVLGGAGDYYPCPFTIIYAASNAVDCVITPSGGVSTMENAAFAICNGSRYLNDTITWLEHNSANIRTGKSSGLFN